jgi:hypothetical protein
MATQRDPGRRENHGVLCALAILVGVGLALVGFIAIGGAIGYVLGGCGLGLGAVGLRGALTGETPRLF